jgi:hypothetical protein
MKPQETITFRDRKNWFTIEATLTSPTAVCFTVYAFKAVQGDEIWYEKDYVSPGDDLDTTMRLKDARTFADGYIRLDGSSDFWFNQANGLNFPSNPGKKLKDLMDRLYDMAGDMFPEPGNSSMKSAA